MKKFFGDFFREKNVLITGHTGFIGSWLTICLRELGANIIGYALPPHTNNDNFVVSNLQEKIIHNIGDLRDFQKLKEIFNQYHPEIVYHLAAQPIVRKSYSIPKDTYDINIGGTVNIFEIFRITNEPKILINFTTDKCYENKGKLIKYKETDRIGGYDPYSSSKSCSELITSAYRLSFFNSESSGNTKFVSSVRCGNVIGGGDWQEDRLIPDIMRAIKNNNQIFIRNPQFIRPWLHVLEPIRGMLILTKKMWNSKNEYSNSWNFGPEDSPVFSVDDIVQKVTQYIGKGKIKRLSRVENKKLHESKLLLLDSSKANRILGWMPVLKIDEIVKLVCDWYLEENVNYDFDVDQIKYYFNKVREMV